MNPSQLAVVQSAITVAGTLIATHLGMRYTEAKHDERAVKSAEKEIELFRLEAATLKANHATLNHRLTALEIMMFGSNGLSGARTAEEMAHSIDETTRKGINPRVSQPQEQPQWARSADSPGCPLCGESR